MADEKSKKLSEKEKQELEKKEGISIRDFWKFFKNTSALGLAIGVVMADAVNKLISSLVNGVITPFISIFLPKENFESLNFMVLGSEFKFGNVLTAIINFFVIAILIYLVVKGLLRKEDLLPASLKKSSVKVSS